MQMLPCSPSSNRTDAELWSAKQLLCQGICICYLISAILWTLLCQWPSDRFHGGIPPCWGPCGSTGTLRRSHLNPHQRWPSWPQVTWSCATSGTWVCLPWLSSHHMFRYDISHLQLHQCHPAILSAVSTNNLVWSADSSYGCHAWYLNSEVELMVHGAKVIGNLLCSLQIRWSLQNKGNSM